MSVKDFNPVFSLTANTIWSDDGRTAIDLTGRGSVKGELPKAAILRTMDGLIIANCTLPETTSRIVAGLSLPNKVTGHSLEPCSRKLTRAWRYGQSLLLTSSAATSSIKRDRVRSEEHTSELQSQSNLVCRLLLEKK